MSRLLAALIVLSLLTRPDALSGQSAAAVPALSAGARVRIARTGEKPRIATVIGHSADTLVVKWPEFANPVPVPIADISRLDVSTGQHRRVLNGMALGTASVGALGAVVGMITYKPCTSTEFLGCLLAPESRSASAVMGGAVGGALGLVVGTIVGLQRHESWRRVPLEARRSAVSVSPHARGTRLGLALTF